MISVGLSAQKVVTNLLEMHAKALRYSPNKCEILWIPKEYDVFAAVILQTDSCNLTINNCRSSEIRGWFAVHREEKQEYEVSKLFKAANAN